MRWSALALALLAASLVAPGAVADPVLSARSPGEGIAVWSFENPANYTVQNASITASGASLEWRSGVAEDTLQADFALASLMSNVDVMGSPGDVSILNTSGSGSTVTDPYQPGPAAAHDTYMWLGGGWNTNFGGSPNLMVGFWDDGDDEWNRALLRFPGLPIPANSTLVDARFRLYLHTVDTPDAMSISVHRVTTGWSEFGASWNASDGSNPWNSSGGDFDATPVDVVPGITTIAGWYEWNVTALVRDWHEGTVPDHGLLVRQIDDENQVSRGRKQFYSSDETNATARPTLVLTYSLPGSTPGVLESRAMDASDVASWHDLAWTATVPPGTSLSVRVRAGPTPVADANWSPWSLPYGAPVALPDVPRARYLQYRLELATTTTTSPVLHDLTIEWDGFASAGEVVMEPFRPSDLREWSRLGVDALLPSGTGIAIAYSQDGGGSWTPAAASENLSALPADALRIRVQLDTSDTTRSPRVLAVSLEFRTEGNAGGGGGGGGGGGFSIPVIAGIPIWVLLIPFGVLAAWMVVRDLRREPYETLDAFLIHEDGRLLSRAGGLDDSVRDELAVSGMFTIVAEFVKDSFGGEDGGDLKSFQVDDREVTVSRLGFLFLALVGRGTPPPEIERNMRWFLRGVTSAHGTLRDWDGLEEGLGDLPQGVGWFLRKGFRKRILWPRRHFRC